MTDDRVTPDDDQPPTSLSLLERARAQDPEAWRKLVDLYTPQIYKWCCKYGLQNADAEDVGQQVFHAVARKLGDFRRDRPGDSFRGWLRTITHNKVLDWYEKNRKAPAGYGGTDGEKLMAQLADQTPEPEEERNSDLKYLYLRALETIRTHFEERTWRMFWLVAIDDRPPGEVASEMNTTTNAVYLAKCRVLHRLREEFADLLEGLPGSDPAPAG